MPAGSDAYEGGTVSKPTDGRSDARRDSAWPSLRAKIEHYLDKQPDGCWIWSRAKLARGYGLVRWGGELVYVHRAMLTEIGIDLPDGMDVDHLCRVPACANPDHLEVVTHRENVIRGVRARTLL